MSETIELRQVQQKFIRRSTRQFSPRDAERATEWLVRWVRRHSESRGFAYTKGKPEIMRDAYRNEWNLFVHVVYARLEQEGEWPVTFDNSQIKWALA